MRIGFINLADRLFALKQPIYYMCNPGNWGDALIDFGAKRFFSHFGINVLEFSPSDVQGLCEMPEGVVLFGGGGAWCNLWSGGSGRVRTLSEFHKVIVLPSSYEKPFSFENVEFWRRDHYMSKDAMPKANFCDDMAFFIGSLSISRSEGVANCFRKDKESSDLIILPEDNLDISMKGTHEKGVFGFFDYLSRFSLVNTDRLHVSIACSLMNIECNLYSGSYPKNYSVFMSSIRDYTNVVKFHSLTQT